MDCAYGTIEIDTAFVTALDDPSAVESSKMCNMKYKKLQGKVIYSGGFEANRFHGKGTLEYANGTRF
jgi:hypothetical protein